MSDPRDKDKNDIEFSWGKKKGRGAKGKDIQFYESFRYDGVEYRLYDCVYLYKDSETEPPYVGKLLKIWEVAKKQKKVKVLWFFHPSEISNYLDGVDVLENELFLASGDGKGLCDLNPLEAIAGKCNVVCISKDERNRQPSVEELKMAHYVYYRTFNVASLSVSDKLDEKIATVEVKMLLNKNDNEPADLAKLDIRDVAVANQKELVIGKEAFVSDKLVAEDGKGAKDKLALPKFLPVQGNDTVGPANNVLVVGLGEKSISDKDTVGVNGDLKCDAGVDSLSFKDDKELNRKGDAAKAGKSADVTLPSSDEGLSSGQKINSKSPDSDRVSKSALNVVVPDSGKSETANQVKRGDVGKDACESRPSKKPKLDGITQKSISSSRDGVAKAVRDSLVSNETVQPAGCATAVSGGKLGGQLDGSYDGLPRKEKSNGVVEDKPYNKVHKVSVKHSNDPENSANRGSQRHVVAAECNDRGKLSKGLDVSSTITSRKSSVGGAGSLKAAHASLASNKTAQPASCAADGSDGSRLAGTTNVIPRKPKSNNVTEENSDVKLHKAPIKQSKDGDNSDDRISKRPVSAAKYNDGGKVSKGLNVTNDDFSNKRKSIFSMDHKPYGKTHKVQISKEETFEAYGRVKEVTTRPPDRSKWFTASPWEDRLKEAHDQEKLVFLQNLDPTYSSSEVENIIWHGFGESCTAQMLPHTATSSRHSGQAFAIFKTREVAQKVLMKLDRGCLMLPNDRPLVGSIRAVRFAGKQTQFFGHLVLDKTKQQMQRESREAVSTSHSSQSNTLEYEMALEWRLLQDRSDLWWKRLYKQQGEDVKKMKASLKSNFD